MDANASTVLLGITGEEADLAYEKVENYLRACRISSKLSRARLAALFVNDAARDRSSGTSSEQLVTIAVAKAQSFISRWVSDALPDSEHGRLSLSESFLLIYLSDIQTKYPGKFLSDENIQDDIKVLFKKRIIRTGPNLEISSMVPRKIDMGVFHEIADSTMHFLNRWPFIKILAAWLFFILALILFFFYTRGKVL